MNEKDFLSNLDLLVQIGEPLGAFNDKIGQVFLKCYHLRGEAVDAFVRSQIEQRVRRIMRQQILSGLPFKQPQLHKGDYFFGIDRSGKRIITLLDWWNAHSLTISNTGGGKTNLTKFHAIAAAPFVRGMWLVDLRKKEFRALRPILAQLNLDLKIVRGRKFKLNPLQVPKGVDALEYASIAAEFLVRVLNLPPRASTLLRSTLIRLYIETDVVNGSDLFPTLSHLFEAIRQNHKANSQARLAILDNLEAVLLDLGQEVLGFHRGWDVDILASQHLVLELGGISDTSKDLILNYLITSVFTSRLARGISNQGMDLWISFDEGQRIFSRHKESGSYGGNPLIDMVGLVRGAGVCLNVSVLTTNDLSPSLSSLTSTKIMGRCGSRSEYMAAGNFIGLNSEQVEWCLHNLVPGLFVGQVSEGTWRYPFLFSVPLLGNRKNKNQPDTGADYPESTLNLACLPAPNIH